MTQQTQALATIDNAPLAIIPDDVSAGALELAIGRGDLSKLSSTDRLKYIGQVCKWVGLNPLTKPIDIIDIKGKTVLYANKSCAEQLRGLKKISVTITGREMVNNVYIVTARARRPDGQEDEAIGAVPLYEKSSPDDRANAMMKAETKAKRRVTLSICGLGFMADESELETIKDVKPATVDVLSAETATDRAAMLNSLNEKPASVEEVKEAEVLPAEPPATKTETILPQATQTHTVAPAPNPPTSIAPQASSAPAPAGKSQPPSQLTKDDGQLTTEATLKVMSVLEAVGEERAMGYLTNKGKIKLNAPLNTLDATAANFIIRCPGRFTANVNEWVKENQS